MKLVNGTKPPPLEGAEKEAREEYIRKQAVVILKDLLVSLR
jgi:hypothetical protein